MEAQSPATARLAVAEAKSAILRRREDAAELTWAAASSLGILRLRDAQSDDSGAEDPWASEPWNSAGVAGTEDEARNAASVAVALALVAEWAAQDPKAGLREIRVAYRMAPLAVTAAGFSAGAQSSCADIVRALIAYPG